MRKYKIKVIQALMLMHVFFAYQTQAVAQILELTCPISVQVDDNLVRRNIASSSTVFIAIGRNNVHSIEPGAINIERNFGVQLNNLMMINDSVFGKGFFFEGRKTTDNDTLNSSLNVTNANFSGLYRSEMRVDGTPIISVTTRITISRSTGKLFAEKLETSFFPTLSYARYQAEGTCDVKAPSKNKF